MNESLTKKQKPVLDYIVKNCVQGVPPSIREICKAIGVSAVATGSDYLKILEKKGYIERDSRARGIKLLLPAKKLYPDLFPYSEGVAYIPLVGRVSAGIPLLAEENIEDYFSIPMSMIGGTQDTFLLKVKGDSMVGDHILDGDFVLVRQQSVAENGEIVVALVDRDEATVKRFYKEKSVVRLQPSNEKYDPIIARDVQICGKVIGLLRSPV